MQRIEDIWNRVKQDGRVIETKTKTMEVINRRVRKYFSKKNLKSKLPILKWLPTYNSEDLLGDFIAGLTVGLTVIPQGIAYALIAGLPPNYGLYSSFMGSFLYVFFGSCKDITIGPTAIMSILTHEYTYGDPEIANLMAFTSGIISFLCGIFNLGFLINFVSKPVITGFTSAAAITIFSSQIKPLFGIKVKTDGLLDTWIKVLSNLGQTRWQDLILGVTCIVVLLLMRKMKDIPFFKKSPTDTRTQKTYKMVAFLVSVGRNAFVVIIATVISALMDYDQPFIITGDIKPGLPDFEVPHFTMNNGTTSFMDIISKVGSGVIILPLIAILENIAIASAFSGGRTIDATQEMIALGLCNVGNSFFQAMPTTGSFSRTAVNANSGVRTPAGGIFTGSLIVLALAVLTPYFKFIPLSALAAVIMCAVIFMVEYEEIVPIWKARRTDEIVLWTSFLICIFWKLEYGIVLGALLNLLILLFVEANPKITTLPIIEEESACPHHLIITPRTGLMYINVEKTRSYITKTALDLGRGSLPIILDCRHFSSIDFSAATGMESLCKDFKLRGQPIFLMNTSPGVQRSLRAVGPSIMFAEEDTLMEILGGLGLTASGLEGESPPLHEKSSHEHLVVTVNGLHGPGKVEPHSISCTPEEMERSLVTESDGIHGLTIRTIRPSIS